MTPETAGHVRDNTNLDAFSERFDRRFVLKKRVNAILSLFIAFCSISAVLYSVFVNHMNLFDRLRYMTFNSTILTALVSVVFAVVSFAEAWSQREVTYRSVYFLRLGAAVTEAIVFAVVIFGLLPVVPDTPDVTSYTGVMMHLVVPPAMIVCFVLNDAPIGKLKWYEPFGSLCFLAIYAVVMAILFLSGVLTPEQAPYSFFDFKHTAGWFSAACGVGVFAVGYLVTLLLARLNRRFSWIWYAGLGKRKN